MLVTMALTLFVMVIISQAFATALETFRQLKGIGDMQERLRTATTLLRSDLAEDHFDGKRRLSDGNIASDLPREGFFFLRMGTPLSPPLGLNGSEGLDADGMPSFRGPDPGKTSDALYFTIKLRGNARERFLTHRLPQNPNPPPLAGPTYPPMPPPQVPFFGLSPLTDPLYPRGNAVQGLPNFFQQPADAVFQEDASVDPTAMQLTYCSQWAEVLWYLLPSGTTDEPTNPVATTGTPLYSLYRAQYLLVPYNAPANNNKNLPPAPATNITIKETTESKYLDAYGGVSCFPDPTNLKYLYFCSPADVTNSNSRTINARINLGLENPANGFRSSALVLSNVVSFHVRYMPLGNPATSMFNGDYLTTAPNNNALPFKSLDTNPTGNAQSAAIRGLQIIIRVWDPASQQSRQVTVVQDM
jgi:hypothetical protein